MVHEWQLRDETHIGRAELFCCLSVLWLLYQVAGSKLGGWKPRHLFPCEFVFRPESWNQVVCRAILQRFWQQIRSLPLSGFWWFIIKIYLFESQSWEIKRGELEVFHRLVHSWNGCNGLGLGRPKLKKRFLFFFIELPLWNWIPVDYVLNDQFMSFLSSVALCVLCCLIIAAYHIKYWNQGIWIIFILYYCFDHLTLALINMSVFQRCLRKNQVKNLWCGRSWHEFKHFSYQEIYL